MYEALTHGELKNLTQSLYEATDGAFLRAGIPWLPDAWRAEQGGLARELHGLYIEASTELGARKAANRATMPIAHVGLPEETRSLYDARRAA
jgi:hypothetical protein